MVNVHIHQFSSGGVIADAEALAVFQAQWSIYQKLVDTDVLDHKVVARLLHDILVEKFTRPFSFLEIACGDASIARQALDGTRVSHYHGIDMAQPAIDLAAIKLADAPYEVVLDHRDFVDALARRPEPADAVWCGLSIHHLSHDDKAVLMREIRNVVGKEGIFLLYEPVLLPDGDRNHFLKAYRVLVETEWTALTAQEVTDIWHHIETCDFPETSREWIDLGHAAGFSQARQIFEGPGGLLGMFRYEP